jgi:predicted porin
MAQSSVTLYGLISTGISYSSNTKGADGKGHGTVMMSSGVLQPPRWGIMGNEDLGGGLEAIFTLESGFGSNNGTMSQGGRLFGRQAFVGLSSKQYGTLTLGRQYDAAVTLCGFTASCQFAGYGPHVGDNDNILDTYRLNNSVQYKTATINGLQAQVLYAFSNAAGQFSNNNAFSAGMHYDNGPLSLAAIFVNLNHPNAADNTGGAVSGDYGTFSPFTKSATSDAGIVGHRIAGLGGGYRFGTWRLTGTYTNVRLDYQDNSHLTLNNAEVLLSDRLLPDLNVGASYTYTWGNYSQELQPKYHQFNVGVDYFLSKRTDVMAYIVYQRAAGDAKFAQVYTMSPSASKTQMVSVIGMRHKF